MNLKGLSKPLIPWLLPMWSMLIAMLLWGQVHGQGEGSLNMDVALQVQGLPENMVILNNLPSQVRITVKGLQARLKSLQPQDVFVPLSASALSSPGVIDRLLNPNSIQLPAGLVVERIQPDRLQLQIDRIISRTVSVQAQFDLPQGWHVDAIVVEPATAILEGPEVWVESLAAVNTMPIRPDLSAGAFEMKVEVITPTAKSVHLKKDKVGFVVRGSLRQDLPASDVIEAVDLLEEVH
ncbi:MAG: CdaR family protein [Mariprofundaceae bacterium]